MNLSSYRLWQGLVALGGLFLAVLLANAAPAGADPAGWWDDRPLGFGEGRLVRDAATVTDDTGATGAVFLLVLDTRTGEYLLSATFDGGCSFCDPIPTGLTATMFWGGESLSAVVDGSGRPVMAIAANADGELLVGTGTGTGLTCAGLPSPLLWQSISPSPGTFPSLSLARAADPAVPPHTHLAWVEILDTGGREIRYLNDLDGDGILGGAGDGSPLVLAEDPPFCLGEGRGVSLLADGHGAAADDTGVEVFFVEDGRCARTVRRLRSVDSGASWSGDGSPPATPPVGAPEDLALSGTDWWTVAQAPVAQGSPAWRLSAGGASGGLEAAGGLRRTGVLEDPFWPASSTAPEAIGLYQPPTTLVLPDPADPTEAEGFLFGWADGLAGETEAWLQTCALSASRAVNPDLSGASPVQLTGLRPPRPEGTLAWPLASAATDGENALLFYTEEDEVNGTFRAMLKRSDDLAPGPVSSPSARPGSSCPPTIEVSWTDPDSSPPHCDLRPVTVHYGTQSGGPYPYRLEAPIGAEAAVLEGIRSNETHYFLIVVEDEAGFLAPAGLDPTANTPANAAWEVSATSPDCPCAAGARIGPATGPSETCAGGAVTLDGAGSFVEGCPDPRFVWSRDGAPLPEGMVVEDQPPGNAAYTLTASCASDPTCTHTAPTPFEVAVHPLPEAILAAPREPLCRQSAAGPWTALLDGAASTAPGSAEVVTWTFTSSEGSVDPRSGQPGLADLSVDPAGRGTVGVAVELTVTDTHGCISPPDSGAFPFEWDPPAPRLEGLRVRRPDPTELLFSWTDPRPVEPREGYELFALPRFPPFPPTPQNMEDLGEISATSPDDVTSVVVSRRDLPPARLLFLQVRALSPCSSTPGSF